MASPILSQRTYRLTRIPAELSLEDVHELLRPHKHLLQSSSLGTSAYEDAYKVATLTFSNEPPCLAGKPDGVCLLKDLISFEDHRASSIQLDHHFEGLTPLNELNEAEASAEIIALTGLGGKPFASWQGSDGLMWLRDHLPQDLRAVKVSIWGNQSSLDNSNSEAGLADYTENFLQDVRISRMRRGLKRLPLILVGHSMGGLIAKAAWVKCAQSKDDTDLFKSLCGLVFFGAPHAGMEIAALLDKVREQPPEQLVRDMKPGSTYLRQLKESFQPALHHISVISCFERRLTPTTQKDEKGVYRRTGPLRMMVDENSACLDWEGEQRIPINHNHSMIAKLVKTDGSPYYSLYSAIGAMIERMSDVVATRFWLDDVVQAILHVRESCDSLWEKLELICLPKSFTLQLVQAVLLQLSWLKALFHTERAIFEEPLPPSSQQLESDQSSRSKAKDAITQTLNELRCKLEPRLTHHGRRPDGSRRVYEGLLEDIYQAIKSIKSLVPLCFATQSQAIYKAFIQCESAKYTRLDRVAKRKLLLGTASEPSDYTLRGTLQESPNKSKIPGLELSWYLSAPQSLPQEVIVEYRHVVASPDGMTVDQLQKFQVIAKSRASKLANALREAEFYAEDDENEFDQKMQPTLHVLHCIGYLDQEPEGRLAFLYQMPYAGVGVEKSFPRDACSFEHWIMSVSRKQPPPLESRFQIAESLCLTLQNLHVCGWIHKNIKPSNVILFPTSNENLRGRDATSNLSCTLVPYLKGFEYSRHENDESFGRDAAEKDNIYSHPARQGYPTQKFAREHDIYALGIMLLEIGTGATASELLNPTQEALDKQLSCLSPVGVQKELARIAQKRLRRTMGSRYATAVQRCILGLKDDNGYHLINSSITFQKLVIEEISGGVIL